MATHKIVVFAGDYCGPEVSFEPPRLDKTRGLGLDRIRL